MKERNVIPEILDSLPADDPQAIRCRRDLALINAVMGNYRWLSRRMQEADMTAPHHWIETGAGDGPLAQTSLASSGGVTGLDFTPRPVHWPAGWKWLEGDLFETLPDAISNTGRTGLIANLFLHHFENDQLADLGAILNDRISRLFFVEPARERLFRVLGYGLFPFVNAVTRHDLQVSIGAGFRQGELASLLGLDATWQTREQITPLGAYHFEAWKA